MRTVKLLLFAFSAALFLLLSASSAIAKPPAAPPQAFALSPSALLALKPPGAPKDVDVEVLVEEINVTFDERLRSTVRKRLIYRVLTQNGAESWASTGTTYHPWHAEKPEIRARVVTKDGVEHRLNTATLVDSAASQQGGAVYSDLRRLVGPLPAMAAGAVVEEEIVSRDKEPYFAAGTVHREVVSPATFTHHWRLVVEAPASVPLRHVVRGSKMKPRRSKTEGKQILTFELLNQKPVKEFGPVSEPDVAMIPVVEVSTGKSWNALARAYARVVDAQLENFDAKTLSDALVAASDDRKTKITKLLAYVHSQVRYTGLELGERALVPAPPHETLGRHYGDCKDKATLLVGLLRSQNIPAYVALLDAGTGFDIAPSLPGLGHFDHAIVYVPGRRGLWIDATAESAPVGVLPLVDQGRRSLVANPKSTKLLTTPRQSAGDNRYREDVHVSFIDGEKAGIREVTTGTGSIGVALRSSYADTTTSLEARFARYAEKRFDGKLARATAEHTRDTSKPVRLELLIEESKLYESYSDGAFAQVVAQGLYGYIPVELQTDSKKEDQRKKREKRKTDEEDPRFRYLGDFPVFVEPHVFELSYHLNVPPGFTWDALPEDMKQSAAGITVWRKSARENERLLRVEFGIKSEKPYVSVKDAHKVQRMLTEFDEKSSANVRFVHSALSKIERGEIKAGLAVHQALIAEHPNDHRHVVRYADSLVGLGFGAEARKVAAEAVRRWPKTAKTHWALGYVSLFDRMGRDSFPGADFATAETAFRKAITLDPDDADYRGALRAVLNAGKDKSPLSEGARHRESLALLLEEKERFGKEDLDEQIVRIHLWLGEFGSALALAETMKPTTFHNVLWVAALMGTRGFDAAREKATELSGGDPRQLLFQAGSTLAVARHYDLAHTISTSEVTLQGHADSESIRRLHDSLKTRKDCLKKLHPAARVVHRFVQPLVTREDADYLLAELSDKGLPANSDAISLRHAAGRTRAALGSSSAARTLMFNASACESDWTVTEKHGAVRVRVHPRGTPADENAITWYLRKRGKRYEIVGAQQDLGMRTLGRQVLHAIDVGKPGQARAWLGWADELLRSRALQKDSYSLLEGLRELWPEDLDKTNKKALRVLGAVLSSWSAMGATEQPILEAALRDKALSPKKKRALEYALAWALAAQGDHAATAKLLDEHHQAFPKDRPLWRVLIWQLSYAGEHERALAELDALEKAYSDTEDLAESVRAINLRKLGRFDETLAAALKDKSSGAAKPGPLNNVAWATLFYGDGTEDLKQALELAKESTRLSKSANTLHTLATIQAELGELDAAHRSLMESIKLHTSKKAGAAYWYTLARIARGFGLDEAATDALRQIDEPEHYLDTSFYHLYLKTEKPKRGKQQRSR